MPLLGVSSVHTMCGRQFGWLYNDNTNKSIGHSESPSAGMLYTSTVCFDANERNLLFSLIGSSSRLNERRLPRIMARGEAQLFL